jgi:hypothetical protein
MHYQRVLFFAVLSILIEIKAHLNDWGKIRDLTSKNPFFACCLSL